MRFVLLSDIHPVENDGKDNASALKLGGDRLFTSHPFEGLYHLIDEKKIKADYILCAGDLGTKSNPSTIEFSWNELNMLKNKLSDSILIATPGNHDHDSRSTHNEYDPKGFLQTLTPSFPFDFKDDNSHFWAYHFDIFEDSDIRVVVLNSSAFHGINDEYQHGRVTEFTSQRIQKKLAGREVKKINILLCHHHIKKHEEIRISDYDAMHGAEKLLQVLEESCHGDWMIVHGHKHFPKVYFSNSSSGSPAVVLSLGSFSGDISGELGTVARNQVYELEFDLDDIEEHGLVGSFRAWDWTKGRGWVPATERSGLPHCGGFGVNIKPWDLLKILKKETDEVIQGEVLYERYPEFKYITPQGLEQLSKQSLDKKYYEFFLSKKGTIESIAKVKK